MMHEGLSTSTRAPWAPPWWRAGSPRVVVGDGSDVGGGASIMGTLGGDEMISIGERCLLGANAGVISLGDDCIVEAGLYVTAAPGDARDSRQVRPASCRARAACSGAATDHGRSGGAVALRRRHRAEREPTRSRCADSSSGCWLWRSPEPCGRLAVAWYYQRIRRPGPWPSSAWPMSRTRPSRGCRPVTTRPSSPDCRCAAGWHRAATIALAPSTGVRDP